MTSSIGRASLTRILMHCHEDHVELGAVLLRLHLSLSKSRILCWRCRIRTSRRLSLTLYRCLRKSRVRRHGHPSWLETTYQTNQIACPTTWCGQNRSCVLPSWQTRTSRWSQPGCQAPWERVAIYSGTTKALWHQWSRLCLREGVLYRKFWSADGLSISLQLVVPYQYRVEFIRLAHENIREVTSAGDAQKLKSKREAIGVVGQKTSVVFLRTCRPCM